MSQRPRKSQKSLSQPSTSSRYTQNDDDLRSSTQIPSNETLNDQEHAHHVANMVKYILAADRTKTPIVRSSIGKAVNCQGKGFRSVINSVEEVLKDVFGYQLVDLENGKLILTNMIKNDLPHLEFTDEIGNRYVLLLLTLAHIFMNGESCTEGSLENFLIKLGIIEDRNRMVQSEVFGNVLDVITVELVKEKYLELSKSENTENQESELRWGKRAFSEISVRTIMDFVSKVYGDRETETWPQQHARMIQIESQQQERVVENA